MPKKALPKYLGVVAFGVRAGVILPGDDIVKVVCERVEECSRDGLLDDGDIVCVTESVVARSQNNYVTEDEIALEVRDKLGISDSGRLGVLFPIVSRNRFAPILRGLAKAVPKGKLIIQISYPCDEVGNQTVPEEHVLKCDSRHGGKITLEDVTDIPIRHPITGVDYLSLYRDIVRESGAEPVIIICNDPLAILEQRPDSIIISDIHGRRRTRAIVEKHFSKCTTLQDICSDSKRGAWSEWGLLGSNLSSGGRIKLPPREGNRVASNIKNEIARKTGKRVEVVIYGDGAYKDPESGIYELADPQTYFGLTEGLEDKKRTGVKYKWLADTLQAEGKGREEIESSIETAKGEEHEIDSMLMEGTTPRKMADVVSSLADLVSGSADAGTPIVVVKGLIPEKLRP